MSTVQFIEPFFGGSHRQFAEGLAGRSRHRFALTTLPGRYWKWRMRGAAPILAERTAGQEPPDLLIASSMLNLAEFLGLADPHYRTIPRWIYFHENQLTYPLHEQDKIDHHFAMIQLSGILAADRIVFNSSYHRREFIEAIPPLLASLPDYKPRGVIEKLETDSTILPPGISFPDDRMQKGRGKGRKGSPTLLWNHRWEHDKGPDLLLDLLRRLRRRGIDFRLIVTGAGKHERADVFQQLPEAAGDNLLHMGYVESREEYEKLLRQADIVLSTARHEFFGISVIEAVGAGAFPLLPQKLSYPEIIDPDRFEECYYKDNEELESRLIRLLSDPPEVSPDLMARVRRFDWEKIAPRFDEQIEADLKAYADCRQMSVGHLRNIE